MGFGWGVLLFVLLLLFYCFIVYLFVCFYFRLYFLFCCYSIDVRCEGGPRKIMCSILLFQLAILYLFAKMLRSNTLLHTNATRLALVWCWEKCTRFPLQVAKVWNIFRDTLQLQQEPFQPNLGASKACQLFHLQIPLPNSLQEKSEDDCVATALTSMGFGTSSSAWVVE